MYVCTYIDLGRLAAMVTLFSLHLSELHVIKPKLLSADASRKALSVYRKMK